MRVLWEVPYAPDSLNAWERMHWSKRSRTKDEWERWCRVLAARDRLHGPYPWVHASADVVFRRGAHRDLSNYDAVLWKVLPDVLQRIGLISDDTEEQMLRGPVRLLVEPGLGGRIDPRVKSLTRIVLEVP